jgi:hypothetical protein
MESWSAALKPRGGSVSPLVEHAERMLVEHAERILSLVAERPDLTLMKTVADLLKRGILKSE